MKENPNAHITVNGYADELGGTNYNTTLSQKRADAVKNLLVKQVSMLIASQLKAKE